MKLISKLAALCLMCLPILHAFAQTVAITMDNPNSKPSPMLSAEERDLRILSTIADNHLKVILFAQGKQIEDSQGAALLQRWNDAGHIIGNHTYSHISYNTDITEEQYETDVLKNEKILEPYPNFTKIFRFPFLKEGNTLSKRDGFRKFLHDHHYQNGSVTIDCSDWYINGRLEKRLAQNPNADINPYKEYYLQHIWSRAQYYDKLAFEVLGRSPNHTLLVHHNLLNALFLKDIIQMFKDKGWKIIDADIAFQDPVFRLVPNTIPAGESLIWALAKETGRYDDQLRYPGEDGYYEKDAMDKLGL